MFSPLPAYDRRVHRVAQAIAEAARPLSLYLFGSRARGDYRPDSDIDLLLVTSNACNMQSYAHACQAARRALRTAYGRALNLDLLPLTQAECLTMARARNHVVRQARREGVLMYGASLPPYDENEPAENWPDALERMEAAQSALDTMPDLFDNPAADRWFGFLGRQALENALQGYLAVLDVQYDYTHNLLALIDQVNAADYALGDDAPLPDWLEWLNFYAVKYRYAGARKGGIADRRAFYREIQNVVASIRQRILALTGRSRFED